MTDVQRDLGRMEARIETLVDEVGKLRKDVGSINSTLSEAKGGWRMLLLFGGGAGAVGGLVTSLIPYLTKG